MRDGWTFLNRTGSLRERWALESPKDALIEAAKGADPFGVISAYTEGARPADGANHERLGNDLRGLGLEPQEGIGVWAGVVEQSFLVPLIPFGELVKLAAKYDQQSVIYRGLDGLMALYDLDRKKVWPAVTDQGELYTSGDRFLWGPPRAWDCSSLLLKADLEEPEISTR